MFINLKKTPKKRQLWVLVSALVLSFTATAQNAPTANQDTSSSIEQASAKQELRDLLARFNSLQSSFTQVVTDMQGQELQSSTGVITVSKPQKLRWEVETPEPSLLIADGATIYNVDPFVEQVTLLDQSDLTQSNPLMLLVSNQDEQWNSIRVKKDAGVFSVYPSDNGSSISELTLSFNSDNKLVRLQSLNQQQQVNVLTFSDMRYNVPLELSTFKYEADPSWIIDDQRATLSKQ